VTREGNGVFPLWGFACFAFVLLAVLVEALAGTATAVEAPSWAYRLAPPAWPPVLRILWWALVAAAAAAYRLAERRAGVRRHWLYPVVSALPFGVFSLGIAVGAEWAAWH
jgi:hypothetical protein